MLNVLVKSGWMGGALPMVVVDFNLGTDLSLSLSLPGREK